MQGTKKVQLLPLLESCKLKYNVKNTMTKVSTGAMGRSEEGEDHHSRVILPIYSAKSFSWREREKERDHPSLQRKKGTQYNDA
jgi:hypothetical protein